MELDFFQASMFPEQKISQMRRSCWGLCLGWSSLSWNWTFVSEQLLFIFLWDRLQQIIRAADWSKQREEIKSREHSHDKGNISACNFSKPSPPAVQRRKYIFLWNGSKYEHMRVTFRSNSNRINLQVEKANPVPEIIYFLFLNTFEVHQLKLM